MPEHVIVWDLETVPDLDAVARAHHLPEPAVEVAREVFNALARFQAARLSAALLDQSGTSVKPASWRFSTSTTRSARRMAASSLHSGTRITTRLKHRHE